MSRRSDSRKYILAALIISLGFSIYTATRPVHDFSSGKPGPQIEFLVADGEIGSSIAQNLAKLGVIKEASVFVNLASTDKRAVGISPGTHKISTHIPAQQALEELLDRKRFTHMVNIVEGSTLSDVLLLISKDANVVGSASKVAKEVSPAFKNPRSSLEGQMFPASYTFAQGTSAKDAITSMVSKSATVANRVGLTSPSGKYSPYQVLTIASMVQIEGDESDYAKVAGVIYNRLRIGMALQLNSTVQYAAGLRGQIALSTNATKIDSPYNTYKYAGLPPTPISNPGEKAILAALHPATHDYLYFITVKPHDTRFTKDYNQFNGWVTEYNKNRQAGLFK